MADTTTPQVLAPEFIDKLSASFLIQPDPEYIMARFLYASAAAYEAMDMEGFEIAMMQITERRFERVGMQDNLAAAMSRGEGGPLLLAQMGAFPVFRYLVDAKKPGEVIKINRPKFIDGVTTEASRRISSGARFFGTTTQPITVEQVDAVVREYVGPLDINGNKAPISVTEFVEHRAERSPLANTGYQLKRDRNRFMDDVAWNTIITAVRGAGYVTRPASTGNVDTGYTGGGSEPMTLSLLWDVHEQLTTRNIPGLMNQPQYLTFIGPKAWNQLQNDPSYERLSEFHEGYNRLFPGYLRSVSNHILCQSNRIPKATNLGPSTNIQGEITLTIAPDCFGWGSAMSAKLLRNRDDDGGRLNEYGWHAYEAWQMLDNRFGQITITT